MQRDNNFHIQGKKANMNAKERIERAEEELRLAKAELERDKINKLPLYKAILSMSISPGNIVEDKLDNCESYKITNKDLTIIGARLVNLPFTCNITVNNGRLLISQVSEY